MHLERCWRSGAGTVLTAAMMVAAVASSPGCELVGVGQGSFEAAEAESPGVAGDAGLPLCQVGKVDDGNPCRRPESDAGVIPDAGNSNDLGAEASPDANAPPTPDLGTDEPCPPPPAPLREGAECIWDISSCILTQDKATCLWSCGTPPDGRPPLSLEGAPQDFVLGGCFPTG